MLCLGVLMYKGMLRIYYDLCLLYKKKQDPSIYFNALEGEVLHVRLYIAFHVNLLLKTHLHPMGLIPSGGSTKVHTWLGYMESISDFMASSHFLESMSDIVSS